MLFLWWAGMIVVRIVLLFVFLCGAFFVREVVHEAFSPARQKAYQKSEMIPKESGRGAVLLKGMHELDSVLLTLLPLM